MVENKEDIGEVTKNLLQDAKDELEKQSGKQKQYRNKESLGKKVAGYATDTLAEVLETGTGLLGAGVAGGLVGTVVNPIFGTVPGFFGGIGAYAASRIWKAYRRSKKKK